MMDFMDLNSIKIRNPWILKWIWNGLPGPTIIHIDLKSIKNPGYGQFAT